MNEVINSRNKVLGLLLKGLDYKAIDLVSKLKLNKWNINNFLGIGSDADSPIFVEYLVKQRGANINAKDHMDENSIFRASKNSSINAFDLLLEYGANYKQINKAGYNCLMYLVGHPTQAGKIINDFDIHSISKNGKTAFSMAINAKNEETIKLLILKSNCIKDIEILKKEIKKIRKNENKKICDYAKNELSAIELNFKLQSQLPLKTTIVKIKI